MLIYELEDFQIIRKTIGVNDSICIMITRIARNINVYYNMKDILFEVFMENYSLFEKDIFPNTIKLISYMNKEDKAYFKKRIFGCLFFELNNKGYQYRLKLLDIIIEKLSKEYENGY